MSELDAQLANAIRVLLRAFTVNERAYPPAEGRLKYNGLDFQAINFIAQHPGCKSADLASFLGVAPTTAQSVVDRLVERTLVGREHSQTNRRAVELTLTDEGHNICAAIRRQDNANCRRMLNALPDAERERFVENMATLARAVEEGGQR